MTTQNKYDIIITPPIGPQLRGVYSRLDLYMDRITYVDIIETTSGAKVTHKLKYVADAGDDPMNDVVRIGNKIILACRSDGRPVNFIKQWDCYAIRLKKHILIPVELVFNGALSPAQEQEYLVNKISNWKPLALSTADVILDGPTSMPEDSPEEIMNFESMLRTASKKRQESGAAHGEYVTETIKRPPAEPEDINSKMHRALDSIDAKCTSQSLALSKIDKSTKECAKEWQEIADSLTARLARRKQDAKT